MDKSGVLIVDKPSGVTSFDIVKKIRETFSIKKVGHCGTLDPLATGVLPVLCGKATKCLDMLEKNEKSYIVSFKLGITTTTQDITGKILKKEANIFIKDSLLEKKLFEFSGVTFQLPPMYSAVKKNGKRLYEYARREEEVKREARKISISKISLLDFNEESKEGRFSLTCSRGTYARTICDDLGKKLNCGAVMTGLRRTVSSGFSLDDSIALNNLKEENLRPLKTLFKNFKEVFVTTPQAVRFSNGGSLFLQRLNFKDETINNEIIRVYSEETLLGLGKINKEFGEMVCFKNFSN